MEKLQRLTTMVWWEGLRRFGAISGGVGLLTLQATGVGYEEKAQKFVARLPKVGN